MSYRFSRDAGKKLQTSLISFIATFALVTMSSSGLVSLFLNQKVSAAGTVTITGDTALAENDPGWMFARDASSSTPYEFSSDQASIGSGSLYVPPIGATAANKFIGEYFMPGTLITDLNSFDVDYLTATDAADYPHFYMSIYANFGSSSPTKFYDCRYNAVATVGSTSAFNTLTFTPDMTFTGIQVTTRGGAEASPHTCPSKPSDMNALVADSTIRMISINVGDSTASDVGVSGYLDNVVVNRVSDGINIYDFEPTPAPTPTPTPAPTTPTDPGSGSSGSSGSSGDNLFATSVANPTSFTRVLGITSGTDATGAAQTESNENKENVKSEGAGISTASTENESSKKSWWWLLLLAVIAAILYALYRRYQQNSAKDN